MFKHRIDETISTKTYIDWTLLSFLAGSIDAGGFMACGRFVTHITGFATLFGIELAQNNIYKALGLLTIPGFFLLGVITASFLVERRFHKSQKNYGIIMTLITLCLLIVAGAGKFNYLENFGHQSVVNEDFVLLFLLSFASGLQNAAISSASRSTLKITHLTGLITDLGISLTHILYPYTSKVTKEKEKRANMMRVGVLISFSCGAIASAFLFLKFNYLGFALPATIACYTALTGLKSNDPIKL